MNVAVVIHLSVGLGIYLYGLNNIDPTTTILAVCKLRPYMLQSTSIMYRWCLTVACFDRYASSCVNVRLRNFAKVHIARRVVAIIATVSIILPVHTLIFYNLKANTCGFVDSIVGAYYHSIFAIVTAGVLPVTIMFACALLTHRNLVLKQQRRDQLNNGRQGNTGQTMRNNSQTKRDEQVLVMLLIQVVIYAILMTPLMCWNFYSSITLSVSNKSSDRIAIERFAAFMAESIIYAFPTSLFYLYTMSSQIFRKELIILVRSALICKWQNNRARIEPMATTRNNIRPTVEH